MATTLSLTIGILLVFALSTCWHSNAEAVALKSDGDSTEEGLNIHETITTMEITNITQLNGVCTLCEEVTNGILQLLRSKKLQKGIMAILHGSCSLFFNLKPKCMETVNCYGLVFFTMVQIIQPRVICQSVHLCSPSTANSTTFFMPEDKCEVCRYVVAKSLAELKYPNKKLDFMMESVLKTCITMEGSEEKCKILISEHGPMIMDNTKHFLEGMDLCTRTRSCDSRTTEKLSSISVS